MSLSLSANFTSTPNLVLHLAQSNEGIAIRVASDGSGVLGVLTASGAQATDVEWVISQNPAWVTISVDPTTMLLTISFTDAEAQANPYQFFITATDGVTTVYFPILLDVKDPLSIAASNGTTLFNIQSYDSTVADIEIQGFGLNGAVDAGVSFIPPLALPSGLNFVTSDESKLILRVADSTSENLSGGLSIYTESPVTTQFSLSAYKPGTMYDNPQRCFTQEFTIESLTAKAGIVDVGLACDWNATDSAFSLNAYVDFLNGQSQAVTYEWDIAGTATGTTTSGGTSSSTTLVWTPTGAGLVTFTFKVKNSAGTVIGEQTIAPVLTAGHTGIPCSPNVSWTSTAGVKIEISEPNSRGFVGDTPTVTISTPPAELAEGETITVNLTISTASSLDTAITLSTTQVTLNAATSSATVPVTIPASGINQKWILVASAANAMSSPTRTGFATTVFESNGAPIMTVAVSGGNSLTSNTGSSIAGITISATNAAEDAVSGATFSLLGAPDGLYINGNQLLGNALTPGTYTFQIIAVASGYARSYSSNVTLTVSAVAVPLVVTDAESNVASLPDGSPFTISWGFTGTPTAVNLIQGYNVRNVLGVTQAALTQVGSSVIAIFGESFYGDAYSVPVLVLSSSITALADLANAPTIGTIDEEYNLTLNWQPLEVDGSYQAYKGWNIWLSAPNATPVLQTINGATPTGLEPSGSTVSSRLFEDVLTAGDWVVDMQALSANFSLAENAEEWDQPHQFPTTLTSSLVTFDNATISIGQSVTITLNPSYTGADTWCVFFPDGTNTGWMPLSIRSAAKTFASPGTMPIIIQAQRNYSTSNPGVLLRRQITKSVFVMNQQFNPGSLTTVLTGDLGLGGDSGWEVIGENSTSGGGYQITNASGGTVTLTPYEVIVRALVRDTMTNELKLMVATARTADASSLLGTMAIDVFPIQGRPRIKDLIDPALYLSADSVPTGNPVQIATTALPNVIVGQAMNDFPMTVAQNSGVGPFSWYVDNLPAGLKMSINGTISGAPTQLGTVTCNFTVMDSNVPPFIAETTLEMTVESNLVITTTSLPQAVVGTPYNIQIEQTGGLPPYTWALVSGALPIGLSIDPDTGVIIGVPCTYNSTTDFSKTYSLTAQITDSIGAIASAALSCTLAPAALGFGNIDQPQIFANESFRLRIPVFGGTPPYTLETFADDGVIGPGLTIANPDSIIAVAGITPPTLAITTQNQQVFPLGYPANPSFFLEATGGVAPYQFSVISGSNTTLPNAAIFGDLLTGAPTADGTYTVQVQVADSIGDTATTTLSILSQQKNAGTYTVSPVSVDLNGSSNPVNWTVTKIAALPDAENGSPYTPGPGSYYGLAVYQSNVLHMTQNAGLGQPMNFSVRSGSLPNGIVAFSGNSFGESTDYSGIVLFNVSGGENATVNGNYSFEAEFSNIENVAGTGTTQAVTRASITVSNTGSGTTPVVIVVDGATINVAPDGAVDSHYTLTASADSGAPGPDVYVEIDPTQNGWVANGPDSKWVGPSSNPNGNFANGSYTYQTTFNLTGLDPTTVELIGQVAGDDTVAIILNGTTVLAAGTASATTWTPFTIRSGFLAGTNTLQFVVTNTGTGPTGSPSGSSNPTGLQVQIYGTAQTDDGQVQIGVFGTGTVEAGVAGNFELDLTTASGSPFTWYYPLVAEGGTGPYSFQIQTGTTLPGATVTTYNGLPALASTTTVAGSYEVFLSATDINSVTSAIVAIPIDLTETPTEPISIVATNMPTNIFVGRAIPANTYYVEADLLANFTATSLPPGLSLQATAGTRAYLSGTPTQTGTFNVTFTATSAVYKTTATSTAQIVLLAQSAVFLNPPTTAVIGTDYRVANNNAIVFIQYTGYQPTDTNLPLPTSAHGTIGAPGIQVGGLPTTGVQNLTSSGFVMAFDYEGNAIGNDTLTIGTLTAIVAVTYSPLVATAKTVAATVSEYSTTATFNAPVTVSGGLAPYNVTFSGFSDPRFSASGSNISIIVDQFTAGTTTNCSVSMLVTDDSGQSTTVVGVVQVTIKQETYITVNFANATWNVNVSNDSPFTSFVIPNETQSTAVLGHAPFQYYVDSVTIPGGLGSFVQVSPSKRVLAIQFNNASTSATVADVNSALANNGNFVVAAVGSGAAPATGSYNITLALRVVDSEGLSSSQTVTLTLVIS